MNSRVALGLALGLIPLVHPVVAAYPRTAHATSVPPAWTLLSRMKTVMRAKGSAHMESIDQSRNQSGRVVSTTRESGNFAYVGTRLNERVTLRTQVVGKSRAQWTTLVAQDDRLAVRTGTGKWQCITPKHSVARSRHTSHIPYIDVFGTFLYRPHRTVNLGMAVRRGQLVWHLRTAGTLPILQEGYHFVQNIYISRKDYTLVRVVEEAEARRGLGVHDRQVINFSRYGEEGHIVLPAACRRHA